MKPEQGFEPGSNEFKATALPFELSSIDKGWGSNLSFDIANLAYLAS